MKPQAKLSQKQASWMKPLQKYHIRIKHKPGTKNKVLDALSRLYIHRSFSAKGVILDWPLIVMFNKNDLFPGNTKEAN